MRGVRCRPARPEWPACLSAGPSATGKCREAAVGGEAKARRGKGKWWVVAYEKTGASSVVHPAPGGANWLLPPASMERRVYMRTGMRGAGGAGRGLGWAWRGRGGGGGAADLSHARGRTPPRPRLPPPACPNHTRAHAPTRAAMESHAVCLCVCCVGARRALQLGGACARRARRQGESARGGEERKARRGHRRPCPLRRARHAHATHPTTAPARHASSPPV